MGGYGSTRWEGVETRETTDGLLDLDVRWLVRRGFLDPGRYRLWWTRGEATKQTITLRVDAADPDAVVLDYKTRLPGEEWEPVQERVPLTRTPCPYGGSRPWFACPGCATRRAVLFSVGGRFRCRGCHDLAHGSTRETAWQRSRRRTDAIRARLAGTRLFPEKPRGMRWSTYERLRRELVAAEGEAFDGFVARHRVRIARLERELKKAR